MTVYTQILGTELEDNEKQVVSRTGLNMREYPSINSRKIMTIPYGAIVEFIEENRKDSIGEYKYNEGKMVKEIPIVSSWNKVKYNQKEGYVFGAYLYKGEEKKRILPNELINKEYILLMPGYDCFNNFILGEKFNWYGLYIENNKQELRKVELSYVVNESFTMMPLIIRTNEDENLKFIIGSKEELKEGRIDGIYDEDNWGWGIKEKREKLKQLELKNSFNLIEEEEGNLFKIEKEGRIQILNKLYKEKMLYPSKILYEGDLNGDGKEDYIIMYGEKAAEIILYLGKREFEEGKILEAVSIYFTGYCC